MKKKVFFATLFICIFLLGGTVSYAYSLWYANGFSPIPAYVTLYYNLSTDYASAAHNAASTWNFAGNAAGVGNVIYRNTATTTTTAYPLKNGKNEITVGARGTNTYLMQTTAISASSFYQNIYEADIDINSSWSWGYTYLYPDDYDIQSAFTHEFGHLLGLNHSSISTATMYPYQYSHDTSERSLDDDDQNGLNFIYQ